MRPTPSSIAGDRTSGMVDVKVMMDYGIRAHDGFAISVKLLASATSRATKGARLHSMRWRICILSDTILDLKTPHRHRVSLPEWITTHLLFIAPIECVVLVVRRKSALIAFGQAPSPFFLPFTLDSPFCHSPNMISAGLLLFSLLPLSFGRPAFLPSQQPHASSRSRELVADLLNEVLTIPITLALNPNNKTGLIDSLMDISNPSSANYGRHLSKSQVNSFVAPSAENVQAVTSWLAKYNVTPQATSPAGDMLHLRVPIVTANAMLNANYQAFIHEETGATVHKTDLYAIPLAMQPHLAFVYPTTQVIPPISKPPLRTVTPPRAATSLSKRRLVPSVCVQGIQPLCIQALYNLPTTPATAPNNSIAVTGFLGEIANQTDLANFLKATRPDIQNGTFSVHGVDGGPTNGTGTLEASLDIDYTVGLATNVPVQFISSGGSNSTEFFQSVMDLVNFLLEQDTPPPVLTTSFGTNEDLVPPEVAEALCFSFAQLGTRGTSVLFASGDGGVAGIRSNDTCGDDGSFIPVFPATCPFVTAVGSTEGVSPENAATFSSGGFSNIFPRPDYQAVAALNYLNALNITANTNASNPSPLAGRFNTTGRAFPDVAMQGRDVEIVAAGQIVPVFGTSASSPMFASMVALVNDQLLNAGRPTLGFLNPLLYSSAAAAGVFNDITVGSNVGCGTAGFPALPGWDAITGLGTPDYVKLLDVAMGCNQSSTL